MKSRGGHTYSMTTSDEIAILRIELEDIEPLIWRRVAVRTSMTLRALHSVIQTAMGWLDSRLWEFASGGRSGKGALITSSI